MKFNAEQARHMTAKGNAENPRKYKHCNVPIKYRGFLNHIFDRIEDQAAKGYDVAYSGWLKGLDVHYTCVGHGKFVPSKQMDKVICKLKRLGYHAEVCWAPSGDSDVILFVHWGKF